MLTSRPPSQVIAREAVAAMAARDRLPRRRRMPDIRLLIGAGILAIVLAVIAIPAIATLFTLKAAGDDLKAGATRLEGKGLALTTRDTQAADADFLRAEQRFLKAEAGLRTDWAFALLSLLPAGKRQVDAAIILTHIGTRIGRAGHEGVRIADTLIAAKVVGPGTRANPGDTALAVLDAVTPRLEPLIAELAAADAERARLPGSGLVWPLPSAVAAIDSRLGGVVPALQNLRVIEPSLRELLGANGPRNYLILQLDSAEIRPTGGFIGSFGLIGFDHGKMRPYESHAVEALDFDAKAKPVLGQAGGPRYVTPPTPFQLLINSDSWELRDANWSPDFPTSARQAEFFFNLEKRQPVSVQGVLSIDPTVIADILTVTGPIYVPETKQTVTSQNFFYDTLVDVHTGVGKSVISYAAKAIMDRLGHLGPSGLLHLLAVVQRDCESRSIQAYFDDPTPQVMVDRYHCGGQIQPLKSDGVFVVDTNMGASKDDYWVARRFSVSLQVRPDGSVRHTLRLHYDGSKLVPNGNLTLPYRDWLRVYLPAGAHVVGVEGIGGHGLGPKTVTDLGRTVVQGWMEFGFQGSSDVKLVYDVNAEADSRHQLDFYWQKQAGRQGDPITVSLQLPPGWSLTQSRVNGERVPGSTIRSDLAVDRQLSFSYQPPP